MRAAEIVRLARRRHGLSQRRLAIRAGTSQAWISRIESGEASPSVDSLERLLTCMGERLVLSTTRLDAADGDREEARRHRALGMDERLERGLAFSEFAAELRDTARP